VPLRIEVGPKDLEKGSLCIARRFVPELPGETPQDQRRRRKAFLPRAEALASIVPTLAAMQKELLERARAARAARTRVIDKLEDYEKFFKTDNGGFAWVHWAGTAEQEEELAKRFETSIRCIPFEDQLPEGARGAGVCILTGKPSARRVLMAKSY
jgi:prolyl-tRNA synthetase